ncbi:putative O-glycosylation ligase, exosortase A system-associated [Roseomonas sp. AR75]|uniref:putative O-glycosylation ligase, exosortase A system-associated n=1 Tax=Roseomonas sp. AR75 TaxID=2562311 RepID=UPI0010C0A5B4|nr:putative O-glycosylation ligase, exosortase A system-associated [Roseomonas sp. AR75]
MRSYVFLLVYLGLLVPALAQPFVGAMLWSWISFMNPHREVWGFATNLPYAMVIFIATAISCIIAKEPKRFEVNAVTVLLLLFGVFITFTTITGIGLQSVMWHRWNITIKTIIGALLVACLLTSRRRIHAMIWLMVISIGYYGVKGGIFTGMTGGGFRVVGPPDTIIADRNHIAVALLVTVPLMNYLRLQSKHYIIRVGLLAAAGLTLLGAIGSQSRGALVALAATAMVLWWRSKKKIVSALVLFGCIAAILAFMPDSWVQRMNTITNYEEDASAMGRVRIWTASWLLALQYPLTGVGFRAMYNQDIVNMVAPDVRARAVHSIYFEVLGEHGFIGFFIWIGMTIAGAIYAQRLMKLAKNRPELSWAGDLGRMVQVSIVAYLAGGTFLSLSYWDFYWAILLVTAAAYKIALAQVAAEAPARRQQPAGSGSWRRNTAAGAIKGATT